MSGKSQRLPWANSLRGVAAALVLIGHLIIGVVPMQLFAQSSVRFELSQPLNDDLDLQRLGTGIDMMGAGVCLFFLLSGLVISRSLRRYSRSGFLVGRCLRLLPTYAAGYLAIVAAVSALAAINGRPHPFGWGEVAGLVPGLPQVLGLSVIPNDVAWTLVVEMTFYSLCLILFRRLLTSAWVLIGVAFGCVAAQFILLHVTWQAVPFAGLRDLWLVALPFIPVLLIGVRLDGVDPRRGLSWLDAAVLVVMVAAFLWMTSFRVWWPFSPLGVNGAGLTYQLTFVLTIVVFIVIWRWAGQRFDGPFLRGLAAISYPLYVVHLMVGWVLILGLAAAGVPLIAAQAVALAAVVVLAWLLHVGVEDPSHRVGQRWARALSRSSSDAPVRATDADRSSGAVTADG